jgi:hypothetical protein
VPQILSDTKEAAVASSSSAAQMDDKDSNRPP